MDELWLGSQLESLFFQKGKMFCFRKDLVRRGAVSQVGREVQCQVLEKGKRKVSNDFQNPRGWEETFTKEMFYKIALHQKYAFLQITKAPLTHCIYIFHLPVHGRRWTCWVLCTQSLLCCCFSEKKTNSCKGYACTQLAYGIRAIVMFPLRILDFLPQVLVLFVLTECVVDQFLKLFDMLGL